MAISLDQIVEETSRWPEDVVAELIERIVVGHHGGIASGVDLAWKAETRRRLDEITSGKVEGIPLEESLARASRRLRPWRSLSIPVPTRSWPRRSRTTPKSIRR